MNAAPRRGVVGGIFAGGIVLLDVATATSTPADTADPGRVSTGSTAGSDGIGCGNRDESSSTSGSGSGDGGGAGTGDTSGEDGVGSGNQTVLDPSVPVDATGGDDPGVDPGEQDGGDDSPGDTAVLPAVADGAGVTTLIGSTTPVLPVAMLLMGALCLALAGRRSRVGRT